MICWYFIFPKYLNERFLTRLHCCSSALRTVFSIYFASPGSIFGQISIFQTRLWTDHPCLWCVCCICSWSSTFSWTKSIEKVNPLKIWFLAFKSVNWRRFFKPNNRLGLKKGRLLLTQLYNRLICNAARECSERIHNRLLGLSTIDQLDRRVNSLCSVRVLSLDEFYVVHQQASRW